MAGGAGDKYNSELFRQLLATARAETKQQGIELEPAAASALEEFLAEGVEMIDAEGLASDPNAKHRAQQSVRLVIAKLPDDPQIDFGRSVDAASFRSAFPNAAYGFWPFSGGGPGIT
jgi:hypothetical protein